MNENVCYEIILYKYGSAIYNKLGTKSEPRYKSSISNKVLGRYVFPLDRMYEQKPPYNWMIHALIKKPKTGMQDDIIDNMIFPTQSSLEKYRKQHKERLTQQYGKLGKDYFILDAHAPGMHAPYKTLNNGDVDSGSD